MPDQNNPAGRLYLLLDEFRKHPDSDKVDKAWTDVFGIKPLEPLDLSLAISEVVTLVEETKKQISAQNVDHQLYMKPFIQIQKLFTLGFAHKLSTARPFVDDTVMSGLEYCAELLSRTIGETVIEQEKLDTLLENVNQLLENISESDLPNELKILLQDNLLSLRRAILHYRIHGAEGLKKAIEIALGSMWIYSQQKHEETDKTGKELVKNYLMIMFYTMSVVADAYALAQLAPGALDTFMPLLGAG